MSVVTGILLSFLVALLHVALANEHLLGPVERAAGVFVDKPDLVKKYGISKVVLVTAVNYGFLNHFMNFYCFLEKVHMKVLVVSLDEKINDYFHTHNQSSIISYYMEQQHGKEKIGSDSAKFRSKQFILMTAQKKAVVLDILKLGYDVMFADVDVPIISDPFPYLLWNGIDYVHSLNDPCLHRMWCGGNFLITLKAKAILAFISSAVMIEPSPCSGIY
jgi:hypothetical protein